MKVLSLKLKDEIFTEAEKMVKEINISRNAYINEAIEFYNKLNRRKNLAKALRKDSKLGRDESLRVLKEWELIDEHLIP
jgi:metal-responsive CopG/Arc/MetJ family transcriptional regulator